MSEEEMVRRVDAWFASLSPEDQKKFTDRLWAAVKEDDNDERADTERTAAGPAGAVEGPGPDAPDRPEQDPPAGVAPRS
jgi:hypothetical protein